LFKLWGDRKDGPDDGRNRKGAGGASYRLGVDVGGTFTDLLLFEAKTGRSWRSKVPSTPDDPSRAVIEGTQQICSSARVNPSEIRAFLHGTTVATNAILEGKGARVGLIVTEGYRQIMQIARSYVPGGLAAWIVWPKPEPLADLEDTFEIEGRMDANGNEVRPLNDSEIQSVIAALRDRGVEALTVCLINSYTNGMHEKRVGEIAQTMCSDIPVSLSHEILPEMQEYERTLTTVANSSMRPVVGQYVRNLETELRRLGVPGQISLLRSDGGLISAERAREAPVNLLMSGPAGGVAGALWVARQTGHRNILTLDVGGTSTDVALIQEGEPRLARTTDVGDLTVRASSLDVKTVGAGGGSIAHVPELTKALRVGPESAGAVPGPVAYRRGGTTATVTDANVVLGYLPESLIGGAMELDREGATRAVQKIADDLGVGLYEAARGIIDIVNENMFGALRMISVQQGYDPRQFALMGFGGAGPLHANAVASLMGAYPVIIPNSPGVLCAAGDATTRTRTELAQSFSKRKSQTSDSEIAQTFQNMIKTVRDRIVAEGENPRDVSVICEVDIRYFGQAFEVPMAVEPGDFKNGGGLDQLTAAFDEEHRRLFTFNMDNEHELVNLRTVALGPAIDLPAPPIEKGNGNPKRAVLRKHKIWVAGAEVPALIYDRAALRAGDRVPGPAIITEMDATTLILPDHEAEIDPYGNILITPK